MWVWPSIMAARACKSSRHAFWEASSCMIGRVEPGVWAAAAVVGEADGGDAAAGDGAGVGVTVGTGPHDPIANANTSGRAHFRPRRFSMQSRTSNAWCE